MFLKLPIAGLFIWYVSFYGVFYFDLLFDLEDFFFLFFIFSILFYTWESGLYLKIEGDCDFIRTLEWNFPRDPKLFLAYISIK